MSIENLGSVNNEAGSPQGVPVEKTGETQKTEVKVNETQYKELESLVGKQGQELGEFRKFFADISPLLDKLDKSPEIVQAIIDGNITPELAKAAMEGKVTVQDAEIVNKAHEEVKKDLGKKGYEGATPEEINKMVEDKAKEIVSNMDKKFKERDEISAFEANVNDFIARTPDFSQHAEAIDKWLDEHDVTDIAVAYYAVKGEMSEKDAQKKADADKAEAEKNIALNAGGGNTRATHIKGDSDIVDSLIARQSNPNVF